MHVVSGTTLLGASVDLATRSMTKRSVLTLLVLLLALTVVVVGAIVGAHFGLGLSSGQTLTLLAWTPLVHGALMFLATHLWVRSCSLTWGDLGFRRPTTR